MARLLVIDNYDSFVYTIVDYLRLLGAQAEVVRNDVVDLASIPSYDGVLVSPGPGTPAKAGASIAAIQECADSGTPMLGVCLGHQALAELYGATVSHAPQLRHGKTSTIVHEGGGVFDGLPSPLEVTRYHSLAVEPQTISAELNVTASTADGVVMALEHARLPLWGVQFHPESVMTEGGHRMLANWLAMCGQDDAIQQAEGKAPLVSR
ncbi:MAG: gamma-glutamyl-gamma-aminobutyrate hydrolase family protein [Actinomycetaceae bacterium]|nr:gamma-glutamyl-gamma-aminobutyrate hydrolase family protein [Actinomycetaceae bacterium]